MKLLITVCDALLCSFIYLFLSFPQHFALNDPQSISTLRNTTAFNHETLTNLTMIQIFYQRLYRYQNFSEKAGEMWHFKNVLRQEPNLTSSCTTRPEMQVYEYNKLSSSLYHYHNYQHKF